MNCAEVNGLLDLMMDGELTDDQRRELEAHGRECPDCAAAIRSTKQLKALFDQMDAEVDVPLEAQAKWRSAVKAEAAGQKRRRMIRWIASAAAAVVAVAGIGLSLNGRNAPNKGATLLTAEESTAVESVEAEADGYIEATSQPAARTNGAEISMMFGANPPSVAEDDPEDEPEAIEYAAKSDGEAESFAAAGSAVVEADGSAEAEDVVIDAEESDMADFDDEGEDLVCAASAQRAPACELAIHVDDVDTACDRVRDLVEEYEGVADVQALADGSANVYIEIAAENAGDFLSAVLPMDVSDADIESPELSDEGSLLLLLTVSR